MGYCDVSPGFGDNAPVGGRRKLQIPPAVAFGPEPAGCFRGECNIPANVTLTYDINFVGVYKWKFKTAKISVYIIA
ncbi:hypothetical protein C5167_008327 [Papaver somniferum]|uniref:peptidylprolyl isomerase n=1 Tax=Papaver somniferum TaxID=3469 RepID=A0A4Y7JXY2_PAPSO|nr:hypothetical protein C5167_008327 [Papaver somniferum]